MGCPGSHPQGHKNPQRRLYSPLPDPAITDEVTDYHKWLCTSLKKIYLMEALHALMQNQTIEMVKTQKSLGFFNHLFLVPKPNNRWRPILDLSTLNKFLKTEKLQKGNTRKHQDFLAERRMGNVHRFKDPYFHIPIIAQFRKYLCFHVQG